MRRFVLIPVLLLILFGAVNSSAFTVDRTEFAYVTQFGRPTATYDGATEAGLHWKWPWPIQAVQRLDRRLHVVDLPGAELLTHDARGKTIDKTLTVSAYICWQIAGKEGVDRFLRTVGTPERAEAILGQRISSRLGAEISNLPLDELISVAPDAEVNARMDRLSRRLLDPNDKGSPRDQESLRDIARQTYGIDIVDIRLRRLNYPSQVREEIFSRIRSERQKKVADYQSEGEQLARNITSQAEYEARTILADARATEQRLKGQADADADRIRNAAQSKDVAFYGFLKKLAEYQRILGDNKTVLLLSSHRELFDVLFNPPKPDNGAMPVNPITGSVPPGSKSKGRTP